MVQSCVEGPKAGSSASALWEIQEAAELSHLHFHLKHPLLSGRSATSRFLKPKAWHCCKIMGPEVPVQI